MTLPTLTRNQWIAVVALALVAVVLSYFLTDWFRGQAIEISAENGSAKTVFAYLDNTGRHGKGTTTDILETVQSAKTPSGLILKPGQSRSFGPAVGLGDSPTLHVLPVDDGGKADSSLTNDCAFDTLEAKIAIPSRHLKIKWTGSGCEVMR